MLLAFIIIVLTMIFEFIEVNSIDIKLQYLVVDLQRAHYVIP